MYCKKCGYSAAGKAENCPKCSEKLGADVAIDTARSKPKVRWQWPVAAAVIGLVVFVAVPRFFLRNELETIGPTDKLRFMRAFQRSDYRRIGQREVRIADQTLIVIWDLRWNTLPEPKQQEILRIVGKAWHTVGGDDTQFRIEGLDETVASYKDGASHLP